MEAGNLVKNKRATHGMPIGTLGLIVRKTRNNFNDFYLFRVKFFNYNDGHQSYHFLYQAGDLERVS